HLGVARQRGLGGLARAAQLLVLQLELHAMDLELARELRACHRLLAATPGDGGFCPAAQLSVIALGHDASSVGRRKIRYPPSWLRWMRAVQAARRSANSELPGVRSTCSAISWIAGTPSSSGRPTASAARHASRRSALGFIPTTTMSLSTPM